MTLKRCMQGFLLFCAFLVCTTSRDARAHDPPSIEQCASEIPTLPIDAVTTTTGSFLVPGFFDQGCRSFTWVQFPGNVKSIRLFGLYAGANINSSAWDCNHSTISYALYKKLLDGTWALVTFDRRYGYLRPAPNLTCDYNSGLAFPDSVGSFWEEDYAQCLWSILFFCGLSSATEYRLAIQSWQHNDTALSHPGDACGTESCFWSSRVYVASLTY